MRKVLHKYSFLLIFFFSVFGVIAQEAEYGMASYYGDEFHGGETASGERYDKDELTAAHKTLPFGTRVRVTRLDNKKFVDVRINDKGPYLKGRIIDLSGKAASTLGMRTDGVAEVKVDILGKGGKVITKDKKTSTTSTAATKTTAQPKKSSSTKPIPPRVIPKTTEVPSEVFTPKGKDKQEKVTKRSTAKKSTAKSKARTVANKPAVDDDFKLVTTKNLKSYGLYKIELASPKNPGYGVQIASLSSYANVLKQVATLQGKWFKNILMSIESGTANEPLYKVILGPFPDQETAESYKRHAKKKGVKGFVVSLEDY